LSSEENEVIIDKKLIHTGALHKLISNGGSIKFNHFGIRIVYNPQYPNRPMVEARLFAVPMGAIYKGNVNPSLGRAEANRLKKENAAEDFAVEEGDEIDM